MNEFYLIADESGAKGKSGTKEKFPGESGVFAGILVPKCKLQSLLVSAQQLQGRFGNTSKFRITDVDSVNQGALREEFVNIISRESIPCIYEAIYVAGFHAWFEEQRQGLKAARNGQTGPIKPSGGNDTQSLHDYLFQGLVGKGIAWCEENYQTNYRFTVLLDNIDRPIWDSFLKRVNELLGDLGATLPVTGFNLDTQAVVTRSIRLNVTVPVNWQLQSGTEHVDVDQSDEYQELSIFPDILSNWLNFEFNKLNEVTLGAALCRRAVLKKFPLVVLIFGFCYDQQTLPLCETLFRHPNANSGSNGVRETVR